MNAPRDLHTFRSRRDQKRAAIFLADVARDEATSHESIEDARQRRPFVRQAAMEFSDCRGPRRGEQREDVALALRETVVTQVGQVQADAVRRSMNRWHQT